MAFWSTIKETPGLTTRAIVFTEGVTFTVKRPAGDVFRTITNFSNYGSWNTWSPSITFRGEREPNVGSRGILSAKALKRDYELPIQVLATPFSISSPKTELTDFIKIVELESSQHKNVLAFRGLLIPSWLAVVERVHTVAPNEDGLSCQVSSWESMGGWGAYVLKYFFSAADQVRDANQKFSADLKLFLE